MKMRKKLRWGSAFGATAHDAAHDAFMTLPHHTRTREGEVQPGGTDRSRSLFSLVPSRDCCKFWNERGGF